MGSGGRECEEQDEDEKMLFLDLQSVGDVELQIISVELQITSRS